MTERDLYIQCIPMIAEMAVRCRKLTNRQYAKWKHEVKKTALNGTREFIGKVLIVIDTMRERGGRHNG